MTLVRLSTIQELTQFRAQYRRQDIAFVPTMGALHAGHLELIRQARAAGAQRIIVSIFVNPIQFGPNEDFDRYPRTFEADCTLLEGLNVDAVFCPSVEEMVPPGFSISVEESKLSQGLCGPFRPGHFSGVLTIVLKLFELVRPGLAIFGRKDAQQLLLIEKMVKDLSLPVRILGVPTLRESDGLAMSSRNRYLSPQERRLAPELYQSLTQIVSEIGHTPTSELERREADRLTQLGFKVQYLEIRSRPNLTQSTDAIFGTRTPGMVAVAAVLGKTRLIDNLWFGD